MICVSLNLLFFIWSFPYLLALLYWKTLLLLGSTFGGLTLANPNYGDNIQASTTVVESGSYTVLAQGYGSFGGRYSLFIRCELANGTVVEPGDVPPIAISPIGESTVSNDFSGFGFPGIPSRDFSTGIEIPLTAGQTQIAPIGSDVALYSYNASDGEVATLNVSRASGNISIGIAVIHRDSNEIIFLGGLPSSDNLSVQLIFPSNGTYAIGLFRLDTTERSGTSGAVQITIQ